MFSEGMTMSIEEPAVWFCFSANWVSRYHELMYIGPGGN